MLISKLLYKLYGLNNRFVRGFVMSMLYKLEGGELYSNTLRNIFRDYHKVDIGLYTAGCFAPLQFDKYTTIGRYSSIAGTARVYNRNHPMEFKSTQALFFNPVLEFCEKDIIEYIPTSIGHDVWIGHNAIIMPHVNEIGIGAVIGAGAVVNKNIRPYAIVVGNPARVVRYRFSKDIIKELLASKWWEKTIDEIRPNINEYVVPYGQVEQQ